MADEVKLSSDKLGAALWACANEMRSKMDASDYKSYLLGLIFYKALSDRELYAVYDLVENHKPQSLEEAQKLYESQVDGEDWDDIQDELSGKFSFAIQPKNTFTSFCHAINDKTFMLTELKQAMTDIEQAHDKFYLGLFGEFNIMSDKLGKTDKERNSMIANCMMLMNQYNFNDYGADVLGNAYEYCIAQFAENSGKRAGEFYTPKQVSEILSRVVIHGQEKNEAFTVYDPCCGSASLLLSVKNHMYKNDTIDCSKHIGYWGCEINPTTYLLSRMNMILHEIPHQYQHFRNGDTLADDWPTDEPTTFSGVLMNPPYSAHWKASPERIQDPRFSAYGKLAPKSKADYAFLLHGYYHLKVGGNMGIVLPHGVLFRGGAEEVIRKHLIDNGSISAIVGLPAKLFYATGIPVCLIFLKKYNEKRDILFVDASNEFEKKTAQNALTDDNVNKIVQTVINRKDVEKFAHLASYEEILKNDYNLNIPRYVDTSEPEPEIDLGELSDEIQKTNEELKDTEKNFLQMLEELTTQDEKCAQDLEKLKALFK